MHAEEGSKYSSICLFDMSWTYHACMVYIQMYFNLNFSEQQVADDADVSPFPADFHKTLSESTTLYELLE